MQQLHPKAVWLFFFQYLLYFVLIGFFIGLALGPLLMTLLARLLVFPQMTATPQSPGLSLLIGFFAILFLPFLIFVIAIFILTYLWAKWTYENYKYQFVEEGIKIEKGVIWKSYITIPFERIQNVDIYRGILARLLRLSDLQIQTAGYSAWGKYGGPSTEGRLPGLSIQDAENLRDELIKKVKGTKQGL